MTSKKSGFRTRHVVAISVGGMLLGFATAVVLLLVAARADDPAGYPGYADGGRETPWTGMWLAVTGLVLCAVFWLSRGLLNLRARSAPASEWHAQACLGLYRGTANNVQLMLTPADGTGRRWQRVFWSPALAGLAEGGTVRVRVRRGFFGRAIVEAADGSLLWPIGRLRKSPSLTLFTWPWTWTSTRPPGGGLRWALLLAAPFLADILVNGGRPGLRLEGLEFAAFAAYAYGFFFHLWGCSGGVFARPPNESQRLTNTATWNGL
jgi:hypothetical protein